MDLSFSPPIVDLIYPIGAIFLTTNSVDPSNYLQGTAWRQIKDTFLLTAGDIYTNGSTGGEATHTLTINEMPSHTHTQNSHNHSIPGNWSTGSGSASAYMYSSNRSTTTRTTGATTAVNNNTGGGQAHNNMPPYLVVYAWERIS